MLNAVLVRLNAVATVHPEWAQYDLLTHLLAALHLVIENDRLTGGHTEEQIVDDLVSLVALERPDDPPATHRAIAEAVVNVLTNVRDRRLRLRDRYLHAPDGVIDHREQSFAFVRAVGDETAPQPTLRATPEAVNVFQNLYVFDPSDRAAAERYRSQRMLERAEYDEVLSSVERRATAVHGLRGELDDVVRQIGYDVRNVDYVAEIIPRLDEVLDVVSEQVEAEEKFADAIADLAHHAAPDLARLQWITNSLRGLVSALGQLQSAALTTRRRFEAEQDRQLFTYRRITINPQAQLFEPLLDTTPDVALEILEGPLAILLGPRAPHLLHLAVLVARSTPIERPQTSKDRVDPFDLGERRTEDETLTSALLAQVNVLLLSVDKPTSLSELLERATSESVPEHLRHRLPWALAVTVANAYGHTGSSAYEGGGSTAGFDHERLVVVSAGSRLAAEALIEGDDVLVVPRKENRRS
jgi:hypothetical protein